MPMLINQCVLQILIRLHLYLSVAFQSYFDTNNSFEVNSIAEIPNFEIFNYLRILQTILHVCAVEMYDTRHIEHATECFSYWNFASYLSKKLIQ